VRQDVSGPGWRLEAGSRRIVARLAEVACPPELRSWSLADPLIDEFEALLSVLQPTARRGILVGLTAFDRAARLYPRSHGRRFVKLAQPVADAYLAAALTRPRVFASLVQQIKALVILCYYELPQVKEQIGYRPDDYIAAVSSRRLDSYGAQIRAAEASLFSEGSAARAGGPGGDT
jgi:hypothetical protein